MKDKTMLRIIKFLVCLLFALIVLHPLPAQAANIPECKRLPSVAVEDLRNIRAGVINGRDYLNAAGMNSQRLPNAGHNQKYQEYDVDANNPNLNDRGRYRIVALITTRKSEKPLFDAIYFTMNHYQSFCLVN
jgi:guanyl-specific ribonuclease Sa